MSFGELLRSQTAQAHHVAEEQKNLDTHFVSRIVEGKKPVGVKWVFKVKTNADGSLDKFKALLVFKGFTQIDGEDFYLIFAPVSVTPQH